MVEVNKSKSGGTQTYQTHTTKPLIGKTSDPTIQGLDRTIMGAFAIHDAAQIQKKTPKSNKTLI